MHRALLILVPLLAACGAGQASSGDVDTPATLDAEDEPRAEGDDAAEAGEDERSSAHHADEPTGGDREERRSDPAEPVAEGEPPPAGSLEELLSYGFEAREHTRPMASPAEAVAACPPFRGRGRPGPEWYQECDLQEMLARTRRSWLALAIDWEEGGIGEVHLIEGDARSRTERIGGGFTPRRLEALRSSLSAADAQALDDRIGRVVVMEFSLGSYHPLAELTDSEWLLWAETTQDLDDPEWVLWLVSPDGEIRHEIARREAELGACDGGGYWCNATQAECDDAGLRAEGRLCVLPLGLSRVALHGNELALIGSVMVAGHGGMPSLTWFATLPEGSAASE